MTLNAIVENLAFKMGDQFNTTLQESLKATVLQYRAKFIRDDLERNFSSSLHFTQQGVFKFKEVDLMTDMGVTFKVDSILGIHTIDPMKYKILKSVNTIPMPVRLKRSVNEPFSFVGSVDGITRFIYTTLDKFPYRIEMKYSYKNIYYMMIENNIYIINNLNSCDTTQSLKIENVLIRDIFENPTDFYDACVDGGNFADDMEFPIGIDMLVTMTNAIMKGDYPLVPKDGQTVNIQPDDNE